jgi:hypothetical protein
MSGCRFTDTEQQRLFQAIQLYVTMFSSGTPEPDCPALQLVEDALKMPFTGVLGVRFTLKVLQRQAYFMQALAYRGCARGTIDCRLAKAVMGLSGVKSAG